MAPGVDVINESYEISINFVNIGEKLDRNSLIVDDEFASTIALAVSRENLDPNEYN